MRFCLEWIGWEKSQRWAISAENFTHGGNVQKAKGCVVRWGERVRREIARSRRRKNEKIRTRDFLRPGSIWMWPCRPAADRPTDCQPVTNKCAAHSVVFSALGVKCNWAKRTKDPAHEIFCNVLIAGMVISLSKGWTLERTCLNRCASNPGHTICQNIMGGNQSNLAKLETLCTSWNLTLHCFHFQVESVRQVQIVLGRKNIKGFKCNCWIIQISFCWLEFTRM